MDLFGSRDLDSLVSDVIMMIIVMRKMKMVMGLWGKDGKENKDVA